MLSLEEVKQRNHARGAPSRGQLITALVQRMLRDTGHKSELLLYRGKVTKINDREKKQERLLVITNRALYNVDPNDMTRYRRRIPIGEIGSISYSRDSYEFVVHVPSQYDYRFVSERREQIIKIIKEEYRALTWSSLIVAAADSKEDLKRVTWTQKKARSLSREFQKFEMDKLRFIQEYDEFQLNDHEIDAIRSKCSGFSVEGFLLAQGCRERSAFETAVGSNESGVSSASAAAGVFEVRVLDLDNDDEEDMDDSSGMDSSINLCTMSSESESFSWHF